MSSSNMKCILINILHAEIYPYLAVSDLQKMFPKLSHKNDRSKLLNPVCFYSALCLFVVFLVILLIVLLILIFIYAGKCSVYAYKL